MQKALQVIVENHRPEQRAAILLGHRAFSRMGVTASSVHFKVVTISSHSQLHTTSSLYTKITFYVNYDLHEVNNVERRLNYDR